jgi:hypothetical protein
MRTDGQTDIHDKANNSLFAILGTRLKQVPQISLNLFQNILFSTPDLHKTALFYVSVSSLF